MSTVYHFHPSLLPPASPMPHPPTPFQVYDSYSVLLFLQSTAPFSAALMHVFRPDYFGLDNLSSRFHAEDWVSPSL